MCYAGGEEDPIITGKDDRQDTAEILKDVVESETGQGLSIPDMKAQQPQRPFEAPWTEGPPEVLHVDDLPDKDETGDLPFFRTSEAPKRSGDVWADREPDGVPTGLPPLLELGEVPDTPDSAPKTEPEPDPNTADFLGEAPETEDGTYDESEEIEPSDEEDDPPIAGWQLFLAGGILGSILSGGGTYWVAVGF